MENEKIEKFSYSKISTMDKDDSGCPYKYKLIYIDKHFIKDESVTFSVGTLIHETEEAIFNQIKDDLFGVNVDYPFLIKNIKEKFKEIKEKFADQVNAVGKDGKTYPQRINDYINNGIYRLENYLTTHPDIKPVAAEQEFNINFEGRVFHGFIDRIFYNEANGKFIIEDIKTYAEPLEKKKLSHPLQFVFYKLAVKEMFNVTDDDIECAYDLPFCEIKQAAGIGKDMMGVGTQKIRKLLTNIDNQCFEPNPSPLCHWCLFSRTYINGQPDEAKGLCPYYNRYKKEQYQKLNKKYNPNDVDYFWAGVENHDAIMQDFLNTLVNPQPAVHIVVEPKVKIDASERRFIIRR